MAANAFGSVGGGLLQNAMAQNTGGIFDPLTQIIANQQAQNANIDLQSAMINRQQEDAKNVAIAKAMSDEMKSYADTAKRMESLIGKATPESIQLYSKTGDISSLKPLDAEDRVANVTRTVYNNGIPNIVSYGIRKDGSKAYETILGEAPKGNSIGEEFADAFSANEQRISTKKIKEQAQNDINAASLANKLNSKALEMIEVKDDAGNVIGFNQNLTGGAAQLKQLFGRAGIQIDELKKFTTKDYVKNRAYNPRGIGKEDAFDLQKELLGKSEFDSIMVRVAYTNARAANGPGVLSKDDVRPHLESTKGLLIGGADAAGYLRSSIDVNNGIIDANKDIIAGGEQAKATPIASVANPDSTMVKMWNPKTGAFDFVEAPEKSGSK